MRDLLHQVRANWAKLAARGIWRQEMPPGTWVTPLREVPPLGRMRLLAMAGGLAALLTFVLGLAATDANTRSGYIPAAVGIALGIVIRSYARHIHEGIEAAIRWSVAMGIASALVIWLLDASADTLHGIASTSGTLAEAARPVTGAGLVIGFAAGILWESSPSVRRVGVVGLVGLAMAIIGGIAMSDAGATSSAAGILMFLGVAVLGLWLALDRRARRRSSGIEAPNGGEGSV